MSEDFSLIDFDAAETVRSSKSNNRHVNLTEHLGCEKLRAKVWYLGPGDALTLHRQRVQEELYVPLDGPGRLRIGDEIHTVPVGAAVRVPPDTRRQPINDGQDRQTWLIVGAPPAADDGIVVDDGD